MEQKRCEKFLHFDTEANSVNGGRKKDPEMYEEIKVVQIGWYLRNWSKIQIDAER